MEDSDFTPEMHAHARAVFRAAIATAMLPYQSGQLDLFTDEEEQYIQREVERMLYEPKLPNAGEQERMWMERLKTFARDESLVADLKAAAGRYAAAFESLLPLQEYIRKGNGWQTLPGCYYIRRPVTPKTNKAIYEAAHALKAASGKDTLKKWFCECLLAGMPEAVSNFKMECLYLLRDASGEVTRLVRLVNTKGEMSDGPEAGGTNVLQNDMYGGAEKFRIWCLSKGNFTWGAGGEDPEFTRAGGGNSELQLLQSDMCADTAYRVARLIHYCGWHPLKEAEDGILNGLWFFGDCAYSSQGQLILPDSDDVIQFDGEIYILSRKGRESNFEHGRPQMRLELDPLTVKWETKDWEESARCTMELGLKEKDRTKILSAFFQETCRRFHDTVGDMGGWLAVGTMLGYAAGPEFFEQQGKMPSIFMPGEMGSGKTVFANWLMGFHGFENTKGLGLGQGSRTSPVGLCQSLENYSSVAVWFDEYRQYEISPEKLSIIRDSYDRQLANKWSPDGKQRVIRTTPLVSGETDTSDAATRSRYVHQQISASQRIGNHMDWMQQHRRHFVFFWRHLMEHRPEFVKMVMSQVSNWFNGPETSSIPERSRVTYSLAYAAFVAASVLFESHTPEEVAKFKKFATQRAIAAALDVESDKNTNIFIEQVITAYKAGEIPNKYFRLDTELKDHPPGAPNQGRWASHVLLFSPTDVISALQIYLRHAGITLQLRQKDLRDQLSKNAFWYNAPPGRQPVRRIGGTSCYAWGIIIDKHPLGYQPVSDEDLEAAANAPKSMAEAGLTFGREGDPRKGPLFAIIDGLLEEEKAKE
jgi:hypothetical protein